MTQDPYRATPGRYEAMSYRRSGRSGLMLPAISLGLWQNFGDLDALQTARAMLRRAFDRGVTHFDLANNYGPPPGAAEENFGRVLATDLKPYRDEMVISTKAGYRMGDGPYGEWGSRKYLLSSLDASLRRMGLDYVDIFYHHRPDPDTPLAETMGALAQAVRSGKALYVGLSNYHSAEASEAMAILRDLGTPCLIHQPNYSMLDRWIETDGLLDTLERDGSGCIVFSPLQQGILTSKYLGGVPAGSRAERGSRGGSMGADGVTDARLNRARHLETVASGLGMPLAHLALRWVLRDPRVTSALIGARTVEQLDDSLDSLSGPAIPAEALARIDAILTTT